YVYLLHRYYDPATATFTTTDPLVSISGSPYGYVGGDPLNTTDPTGLFPPLLIAFAVGALIEGGIELATQAARNTAQGCGPLDNIDWGDVAQAAAIGGLTRGTARYLRAAKTAPEIRSGIYVVNSADGVYVGQSSNISRRLAQHVGSGKFTADEVANAARQSVAGGRSAREVAEQTMIDRLGGTKNLLNVVNPIGPRRFGLMPGQPYRRP
ncbi:MAG: RHS repeat-associated core domain-containing protein, partial [Nocardioides sp.]